MAENNDIDLAAALRRGREARGETLEQLQQQLGVSRKVLAGIEAGDFDVVEKIYVRLAIWHYAEHVGLDGDAMAQRFEREFGMPEAPVPVHTDSAAAVPVTPASPLGQFLQRQSLGRIVGVVVVILALGVLGATLWSHNQSDDQVFEHTDDYLASPLSQVGGTTVQTSSGGYTDSSSAAKRRNATSTPVMAASDIPAPVPAPAPEPITEDQRPREIPVQASDLPRPRVAATDTQLQSAPISTTMDSAIAVVAAEPGISPAAGTLPSPATSVPEPSPEPAPADVVALATSMTAVAPPLASAASINTVILEASAIDSTWVQVQWDGVDGIEEIIPKGETRRWQAQRFFMVRAGRAHGVRFSLQGELLGEGRLGDATLVLRFRGQADGYQLLGPELEPLGPFTPLTSGQHNPESVTAERP